MTVKMITTIGEYTCLTTDLPTLASTAGEGSIAHCEDGREYELVNGTFRRRV